MKTFRCDNCQQVVFIENTHCTSCGSTLAYLPDISAMAAIQPQRDGNWSPLGRNRDRRQYRLCSNYENQKVCNWAVPASDPNPLCRSCRLTRTIPNLDQEGHHQAWYRMEAAKRRLLYGLMALQLPIRSRLEDPDHGLAFDFLSENLPGTPAPILTGHDQGLITINLAEADDAERERRRVAMHEPYRTLLGHFRHEIGHYYWDVLIDGGPHLEPFRALFGDETQDYAAALKAHYDNGPTPDWNQQFVSEYASSHPWEDWAETWAHYLHIMDALETASEVGLSLKPRRHPEGLFRPLTLEEMRPATAFSKIMERWFPLTQVLNKFNRGLGMADAYPFVLTPPVVAKLQFVHNVVSSQPPAAIDPAQ